MSNVITHKVQITRDWVAEILVRKGIITNPADVINVLISESKHVNCTIYQLTVDYSSLHSVDAPRRLFLKVPAPDFERANKEVDFYNVIAPAMSQTESGPELPILRCYDVAHIPTTGQAHFLFEDLSETHFTVDTSMPPTEAYCEQVIDAYARFHSFWWEHTRLGHDLGERLTNARIDSFIESAQARVPQLKKELADDFSNADLVFLEKVALAWPIRRKERVISGTGVTLVHRDPHPFNFLYPKRQEAGRVTLIDWQSWRVDTGTDDIAYLMAFHWPLEARIHLESALVRRYYDQLIRFGVENYAWEDCLYDYRASILRCLFFLINAWSLKQRDRIEKGMQAFHYWNCAGLLES